MIAALNCVH